MKREATDWEKIFSKCISDKGLVSKIYKEHLKVNKKKASNQISNWVKDVNRHLTKEDIQDGSRDCNTE